jgi:DUF1680 family protein
VTITQQTNYPWEGNIRLNLELSQPTEFALHLRIPGWARNQPVPSDLYRYLPVPSETAITLSLNGQPLPLEMSEGFAVMRRRWQSGDVVELHLPLPVRRVVSKHQYLLTYLVPAGEKLNQRLNVATRRRGVTVRAPMRAASRNP